MQAGQELDILVAENVMGYRWCLWLDGTRFLAPPEFEDFDEATGDEPLADEPYAIVINYSRDISAAWQVVEKMRETWNFKLSALPSRAKRGAWTCSFLRPGDYPKTNASANTAPLAICIAALRATGVWIPAVEV